MRRLAAFAALLAFANLSFVQAGAACAVSGNPSNAGQVVVAGHQGHAGHDMPAPAHHDILDEAPEGDATNTACLMMGPCALVIDVGRLAALATGNLHEDGVLRGSDILPPSPSASPDIPPPRA